MIQVGDVAPDDTDPVTRADLDRVIERLGRHGGNDLLDGRRIGRGMVAVLVALIGALASVVTWVHLRGDAEGSARVRIDHLERAVDQLRDEVRDLHQATGAAARQKDFP